MVNWEGEKTPHYRPTRLAYVRSLIKAELDHYDRVSKKNPMVQSDLFETAPDMLDRLDKMVTKTETDGYAEIVCHMDEEQGKASQTEVELEKVGGVWKIKHSRTRGYQVVSEPGYDEQTPFCTGQTLCHWAANGNAAAQDALSKIQNASGRGGGSPREAAEALLKAMVDFNLGAVYDLIDVPEGASREDFINAIQSSTAKATLSSKWKSVGMACRVVRAEEDGDSAVVLLQAEGKEARIKAVRRNDRWLVSNMDEFDKLAK